jgi:hypothetical protein
MRNLALANKRGRFPVAAQADRTVDGKVFASKGEARRYSELLLHVRAGIIQDLECQPEFKVTIAGREYCRYRADFRYVVCQTGETVIEDVKSSGTAKDAAYRLRRKAAELFHGISVTEVLR